MRVEKWYNNEMPFGLAGFLDDKNSRIIGYPLMRQLRVKNSKISIL
jgi:hypothetical protein